MSLYGIPPIVITKTNQLIKNDVINISSNAATPLANYSMYIMNEKLLKNADIVFYSLDPWIYNEKYYKHRPYERLLWKLDQYFFMKEYLDIPDSYFSPLTKIFKNIFSNNTKCKISEHRLNNSGFIGRPAHPERLKVTPKNGFGHFIYEDLNLFGPSTIQLKYIKKLKDRVEANGGVFVFVLTPRHDYAIDVYRSHPEYEKLFLEQFNKIVGETVLIGSRDMRKYKLTSNQFFDNGHLSVRGAIIYTKKEFSNIQRIHNLKPEKLKPLLQY